MLPKARKRMLAGAGVFLVIVLSAVFLWWKRERAWDPHFDTTVARPMYSSNGPLVLYDEAHLNAHLADAGYKPFLDLLRHDGYQIRVNREAFSDSALSSVGVLVVVCARGTNDANDGPAFSDAETAVLSQWVGNGGSLLLITDHWPYGTAVEALSNQFSVRLGKGMVEDPKNHDPSRGKSHLVFSRENGLLKDHAITRGRNASEQIDRVLTFTGQSLSGPMEGAAFMALADSAVEYLPGSPKVEKSGGDVRVRMEYSGPVAAKGNAQGLALEWGRGRIVILGEAGMLRAQRDEKGMTVGMNVPGYENRQLALNIVHWLSRAL